MKVMMARKVAFSSGHRYWMPHLSEAENRELYGAWASPFNHGHNYVLDVVVEGEIDRQTGMLVNIKRLDDLLKERVVTPFSGKSINDEIIEFAANAPCLENLLKYIRGCLVEPKESTDLALPQVVGGEADVRVHLVSLKLEEMPTLYAELNLIGVPMTVTRIYEFSASHRLHSPLLSNQENLRLYAKCNNPAGHGHNYVLEVTVSGEPSPSTGMIVSIDDLDSSVESHILDRYDHKHLDSDVPELAGKITTSENVAQAIFNQLNGNLPATLERIRLYETPRNMFEVSR